MYCGLAKENTLAEEVDKVKCLLDEVRKYSGDNSDFFAPYEMISSGEFLLSGCSLNDKPKMAQNLALFDSDEKMTFLAIPSWNGETTAGNKEFWDTQISLYSDIMKIDPPVNYQEYVNRISSGSSMNRKFKKLVQDSVTCAVYLIDETKKITNETTGSEEKIVITVYFYDHGMGEDSAIYKWLKHTAESFEEEQMEIRLISTGNTTPLADAEYMEKAGVGSDILLSSSGLFHGYNLTDWYTDLTPYMEDDQNYQGVELEGEMKGLAYAVNANEKIQVFTISESSDYKREAFEFCIRALEGQMRKKVRRKLSVYVFIFLIFCTFVSVQVEKITLPQVSVSEAVPGVLMVNGVSTEYEYTIPFTALEKEGDTYFVYYLQETDGRFGKETKTMRMETNVIAQDGVLAALKSKGFYEMIISTNKLLEDKMLVSVQGKK